MRKKIFAFGIAAIFLFSLVATVGAYPTGFKPPIYPGVREVTVPDLSKFPVVQPRYIINPEDRYPKIIDEKTIIPEPEPEEPEPTPTPVDEDPHEMEFWKWIMDYRLNNELCPFNPNFEINVPALCPWGLDETGDWRIFPY